MDDEENIDVLLDSDLLAGMILLSIIIFTVIIIIKHYYGYYIYIYFYIEKHQTISHIFIIYTYS